MKKKLTFGWIVILVLSLLSFAFYFTKGNLLNYVLKPYLETLVESELNLKASIGRLDLSLFRASLNIFNIILSDPSQTGDKKTLVTIPEIRASLQLRQLLLGNLALDTAWIKHPNVTWILPTAKSPPKQKKFAFSWAPVLRFDFNQIIVESASLDIEGPGVHIQHPNASLKLSRKRGQKYALSITSNNSSHLIKGFSASADEFKLNGLVSFPIKIQGELSLISASIQSQQITELTSSFAYEPGLVTIQDSRISTPISDLTLTASFRFSRLFDLQSGTLTINSIPFHVSPQFLGEREVYSIKSEGIDLAKIFNKKIKLTGNGIFSSEFSLEKTSSHITGILKLEDVALDTLYFGNTVVSLEYKKNTLSAELQFIHPHKDSSGKLVVSLDTEKNISGNGSLELKNFYLGTESFALIHFPFTFNEHRFSVPSWTLQKKVGQISGSFLLSEKSLISTNWTSQNLTLEEFDTVPSFLKGAIEFKGNIEGSLANPQGSLHVNIPHTFIESQDLGPTKLAGILKTAATLEISSSVFDGLVRQKGTVELKKMLYSCEASFQNLDFVPYFKAYHKRIFDFHGSTSGSFKATGSLIPFTVETGLLEIPSLTFASGQFTYGNKNTLKLDMNNGKWNLHPFVIEGTNTLLTLQGEKDKKDHLNLSLEGPFNFHLLQLLSPDVEKSNGEGKIAARIEGDRKHLLLFGTMTVSHGELKITWLPQVIDDLSLSIGFSQNKISIDKFKGSVGGGNIDVFGAITLIAEQEDPKLDLTTKMDHCSLQYPGWISSTLSGELQLSGNKSPYQLEGHVLVHDALYKENLDWQSKIFAWQKERYFPKTQGIATPEFNFNISFDIPRNFLVRNNVAKLETKAALKLGGTDLSPHILGNVDLISGTTFFKGNEFTLTSAHVRFDHPYEINPSFVIHAESTIKNNHIFLSIDGDLSKYAVHLSSDPALAEADIISLLTFGATRSEVEKQGVFDVTSLELGSLLFGGVQEKFQSSTQKSLGITFMLSPSYSDTKHATVPRIFVGRSIGKKIDTTFSSTLDKTAIFTDKEFNIKYNINRNLSLLGLWEDISDEKLEDNSSIGLDLKAQFEFQ